MGTGSRWSVGRVRRRGKRRKNGGWAFRDLDLAGGARLRNARTLLRGASKREKVRERESPFGGPPRQQEIDVCVHVSFFLSFFLSLLTLSVNAWAGNHASAGVAQHWWHQKQPRACYDHWSLHLLEKSLLKEVLNGMMRRSIICCRPHRPSLL